MNIYTIENKKGVIAFTMINENSTNDENITNNDLIETRIENAIDDGYIQYDDYDYFEITNYFSNLKDYKQFIKQFKSKYNDVIEI